MHLESIWNQSINQSINQPMNDQSIKHQLINETINGTIYCLLIGKLINYMFFELNNLFGNLRENKM